MKKIVVFLFVAISVLGTYAQKAEPSAQSFVLGVRGGVNIFDMHYSSNDVSFYNHKYGFGKQLGMFVGYEVKGFFVKLDALYTARGVKLSWSDINYRLDANYLDLRLPIGYAFFWRKKVQPYIMVAPSANLAIGGKAYYNSQGTSVNVNLSNASISPLDFSVFFGGGMRFPIPIGEHRLYIGLEAGYNLGFLNTFSDMELNNTANAVNLPIYEVSGTRKNVGIEAAVTLSWAIPLGKKQKVDNAPKEEPTPVMVENIPEPVEPPVEEPPVQEPEETVVETPEPEPVIEEPEPEPVVVYQTKECYSIEEMKDFISRNVPIDDKRICMFDMKFEFGSAVMEKEAEKQLDEFVDLYKKFPNMQLQISGHTDNVGSDAYNQKLSEDRAKSVRDYFLKKGVPANRMVVTGFGLKYPIDTNDTEEGRAKNRRVEVDIKMIGK
jgi:OOP family OmpA-OmpF porin